MTKSLLLAKLLLQFVVLIRLAPASGEELPHGCLAKDGDNRLGGGNTRGEHFGGEFRRVFDDLCV